jgi:hypothetical protein
MAQFGAPNFLSAIVGGYEQGRDRAERSRLADLAEQGRMLQGAALRGDKNALAELGSVNPQAAMQTTQFNQEQKKQALGDFLSAAYNAKDPQSWQAVVQRFKAQGHQFDPGEEDFANRENMIRQGMSVADQMGFDWRAQESQRAQQNADRSYGLAREGLDIQRLNAAARQRGQITDVNGKRVLIDPMTGETIKELGAPPAGKGGGGSAAMLKLRRETENGIIDLQNTQAVLGRALELAPKAFTGMGAGTRGYLGSRLPDAMVPDQFADKAGADATTEFGNIMSMEAIQSMSNSLKGATTDFELRKFEQVLSDPSVPVNIKQATIKRMMALADSKLALEQQRMEEFGAEMPGAGGGLQPGAIEDGYRYNGGPPADPNSWEPVQ